jgi:hypothetical protein
VLDVRGWAEIRRMREVEGLSIHEIARRTGHHRNDRGFEPSTADQTPRLGNLRRRVSCRDLRVGTLDADAVLDVLL